MFSEFGIVYSVRFQTLFHAYRFVNFGSISRKQSTQAQLPEHLDGGRALQMLETKGTRTECSNERRKPRNTVSTPACSQHHIVPARKRCSVVAVALFARLSMQCTNVHVELVQPNVAGSNKGQPGRAAPVSWSPPARGDTGRGKEWDCV